MATTPTTRGKRLKRLRESFDDVDQGFVADLARLGRTGRVQINKAENGKIEWQSGPFMEGIARAFGMSYEQMRQYLDDELPLEEAIRLGRPVIDTEKARRAALAERETLIRDLLREAAGSGELSPGTEAIVRHQLESKDVLPPDWHDALVQWIRLVNRGVEKVITDTRALHLVGGRSSKLRGRATER